MPVIIDGNNLLHSLPSHERERESVRRTALDTVRHESMRLIVVFDGPPPAGSPEVEHLGRVIVRYSGNAAADDLILDLLQSRGRASEWVVVSDDRALGRKVRERGATVRTLRQWRSRNPRKRKSKTPEPRLSSHDVADWQKYFSAGEDDEDLER